MLPFCGYDMGEYFAHWLDVGQRLGHPPGIYMVNWFRRGNDGRFLWPGYGENMRVLKWIIDRAHGRTSAVGTPIGLLPDPDELDLSGLDEARAREAMSVRLDEWRAELAAQDALFRLLGRTMPDELVREREEVRERIDAAERAVVGVAPEERPTP